MYYSRVECLEKDILPFLEAVEKNMKNVFQHGKSISTLIVKDYFLIDISVYFSSL